MKRTLKPFKGLDSIEFGMTKKKVQGLINVKESEVTNKYLKESKVVDGPVAYIFQSEILVMIENENPSKHLLFGLSGPTVLVYAPQPRQVLQNRDFLPRLR
jgi:hypothetical protein